MKKKMSKAVAPNTGPVHVALPNTTAEKMTAIAELSRAVRALAEALGGVNTNVKISDCVISSPDCGIRFFGHA